MGRKPITLKTLAGEAPLNPRESASLPCSSGTRNNDTMAQRLTVDGGVWSGTKPFNQTFKLTRIQQTHTKIQNQTDLRSYQRILDAYNQFIISDIHVCGNRFRTRWECQMKLRFVDRSGRKPEEKAGASDAEEATASRKQPAIAMLKKPPPPGNKSRRRRCWKSHYFPETKSDDHRREARGRNQTRWDLEPQTKVSD